MTSSLAQTVLTCRTINSISFLLDNATWMTQGKLHLTRSHEEFSAAPTLCSAPPFFLLCFPCYRWLLGAISSVFPLFSHPRCHSVLLGCLLYTSQSHPLLFPSTIDLIKSNLHYSGTSPCESFPPSALSPSHSWGTLLNPVASGSQPHNGFPLPKGKTQLQAFPISLCSLTLIEIQVSAAVNDLQLSALPVLVMIFSYSRTLLLHPTSQCWVGRFCLYCPCHYGFVQQMLYIYIYLTFKIVFLFPRSPPSIVHNVTFTKIS